MRRFEPFHKSWWVKVIGNRFMQLVANPDCSCYDTRRIPFTIVFDSSRLICRVCMVKRRPCPSRTVKGF